MRLVVQRVKRGRVEVEGKAVGEIEKGLFVLIGVTEGDAEKDSEFLAEKLSKLRILSDAQEKMNLSLLDTGDSVLAVSQFTLYADTKKGNRPSFIKAGDPEKAETLYNHFVKNLQRLGVKVETGTFGAYMEIETKLDGPVTITIDSKK